MSGKDLDGLPSALVTPFDALNANTPLRQFDVFRTILTEAWTSAQNST
jgi:hypothetical protein